MVKRNLFEIRVSLDWVEIEFKSKALFATADTKIQTSALPMLAELSTIIKVMGNPIRIEGHTDDVPITTAVFPSNWELSAARAASVVHLLTDNGVDPLRMVAMGYSKYRPVADNSTDEGRQSNRRVVIRIESNATGSSTTGPATTSPSTMNPPTLNPPPLVLPP